MPGFDERAFDSWLRHKVLEPLTSTLRHERASLLLIALGFSACGGGLTSPSPQESSYVIAAAEEPAASKESLFSHPYHDLDPQAAKRQCFRTCQKRMRSEPGGFSMSPTTFWAPELRFAYSEMAPELAEQIIALLKQRGCLG